MDILGGVMIVAVIVVIVFLELSMKQYFKDIQLQEEINTTYMNISKQLLLLESEKKLLGIKGEEYIIKFYLDIASKERDKYKISTLQLVLALIQEKKNYLNNL